jgi:hypothetical protein
MIVTPSPTPVKNTSWPISVGAEGIAAAQFARSGFDVLAQTVRDKPWYDFAVTRAGNLLKVSVKASDDGRWNLTEGFARRNPEPGGRSFDCRSTIDYWADSQGSKTICCLVQFEGVSISQLPRIYLAFPGDIAAEMRAASERTGYCGLHERYEWTSAEGKRELTTLPMSWRFSLERIQELLDRQAAPLYTGVFPKGPASVGVSASARLVQPGPVALSA